MAQDDGVRLRPATADDRRQVYEWLARSDVTPAMMGPPLFSDTPIPTWDEFKRDYALHYFDGSQPVRGQCFIIVAGQSEVGVVCHNALRQHNTFTDVDIWLREEAVCGKGYGSRALRLLTDMLHFKYGVLRVAISPSARNSRAIAAYERAGFRPIPPERYGEFVSAEDMEYEDNVVLLKEYEK